MALATPKTEINGYTVRELYILDAGGRPLMVGFGVFDPNGQLLDHFTPSEADQADDSLRRHAWSRPAASAG